MAISMFISYSHKDNNAKQIIETLNERVEQLEIRQNGTWEGAKVWWDKHIPSGKAWWSNILDEIQSCTHFLYMLSDASLKSEFCQTEHSWAREFNRRIFYIKTERTIRDHLLPRYINRTQIMPFNEEPQRSIQMIIDAISNVPNDPPRPPNIDTMIRPECPPNPLADLVEKVYNFNEKNDGEFVIYKLWHYIRYEDTYDDIIYLANIIKGKIISRQYHDDIELILRTNHPKHYKRPPSPYRVVSISPSKIVKPDNITPNPTINIPSDLDEIVRIADMKTESAQGFMDLWSKLQECFKDEDIDILNLVGQLDLDSELEDINSLVTKLVEDKEFLVNFISGVYEIIPKFGNRLYNGCKQFIGEIAEVS